MIFTKKRNFVYYDLNNKKRSFICMDYSLTKNELLSLLSHFIFYFYYMIKIVSLISDAC